MADEPDGALAPVAGQAVAPVTTGNPVADLLLRADRPMVCSFNLETPEGRQLLQRCEEEPDQSVRELANIEMDLRHVYAKVIDYTNPETSETYPLLRICLVTEDGKVYPTFSDGVREALLRIFRGHGFPPFKKPVRVRVALKALKDKKQRLTLLEVFDKPKGAK